MRCTPHIILLARHFISVVRDQAVFFQGAATSSRRSSTVRAENAGTAEMQIDAAVICRSPGGRSRKRSIDSAARVAAGLCSNGIAFCGEARFRTGDSGRFELRGVHGGSRAIASQRAEQDTWARAPCRRRSQGPSSPSSNRARGPPGTSARARSSNSRAVALRGVFDAEEQAMHDTGGRWYPWARQLH